MALLLLQVFDKLLKLEAKKRKHDEPPALGHGIIKSEGVPECVDGSNESRNVVAETVKQASSNA